MLMSLFLYFYWGQVKESLGKIHTEVLQYLEVISHAICAYSQMVQKSIQRDTEREKE